MDLSGFGIQTRALAASLPAQRAAVGSGQMAPVCHELARAGSRLLALWASDERDRSGGFAVRVLLLGDDGLLLLEHALPDDEAECPDLSPMFPAAGRMQRAAFDLKRLWAVGAADWPAHDFEVAPRRRFDRRQVLDRTAALRQLRLRQGPRRLGRGDPPRRLAARLRVRLRRGVCADADEARGRGGDARRTGRGLSERRPLRAGRSA